MAPAWDWTIRVYRLTAFLLRNDDCNHTWYFASSRTVKQSLAGGSDLNDTPIVPVEALGIVRGSLGAEQCLLWVARPASTPFAKITMAYETRADKDFTRQNMLQSFVLS